MDLLYAQIDQIIRDCTEFFWQKPITFGVIVVGSIGVFIGVCHQVWWQYFKK